MPFSIVIPARYESTRFPGKPLKKLGDKTLIHHVYLCAKKSKASRIIIATDDERIKSEAERFNAEVCMTHSDHATGTDRLAEVVKQVGFDDEHVVVNLQGDEPLMPESVINQVAENLANHKIASASTVCARIDNVEEIVDPHIVKVTRDQQGYALYFSRATIPHNRMEITDQSLKEINCYRHIGLYAYRAGFLRRFVSWPICELERCESLEQLRCLWNGEKIHVDDAVAIPGPGIDTPEDLQRAEKLI